MTIPDILERDFQRQVLQLAEMCGWKSAHFRPAMNAKGQWRTAVAGQGKGFPDLVLVRPGRVLFVELKSRTGKLSLDQVAWIDSLRAAGADVRVWQPADWDEIERELRG